MKKSLIFIVIIVLIIFASGLLFLNYIRKLPQTQLTNQQRIISYEQSLEKDFPNIKNFWQYIPLEFQDGLSWDDVSPRDNNVNYRTIKTSKGVEKVSVIDGFRILYKYPSTGDFAKMHVEKSNPQDYGNDKLKVIDELKFLSKDKSIVQKNYGGFDYYYISNDNLNESPIGTAIIFFPDNQIITTIYFINQKPSDRKFQTIEEFNALKDNFIKELIDNKIAYRPT